MWSRFIFFFFFLVIIYIAYMLSGSAPIALMVVIISLAMYVVCSYVGSRFKNRNFKNFMQVYGREVEPPKGRRFASGNVFYNGEVLVVHVFPLEDGLYFYKSMFCSSCILWSDIKYLSTVKNGKDVARMVISGSEDKEIEIFIPWSSVFNDFVKSKVWLIN